MKDKIAKCGSGRRLLNIFTENLSRSFMAKKIKKRKKPGSPPGTLIFTGRQKVEYPYLISVRYNADLLEEENLKNKPLPDKAPDSNLWLDMRGLSDVELVELLGKKFNIHPLVLEDVLNTNQRPKFEEYDNGVFVVLQSLTVKEDNDDLFEIQSEQVGLFINERMIISFQEDEADLFLPVRERLQSGRGRIRTNGTDYLGYAMLDLIVDNYFLVLDRLEDEIETLESEIIRTPNQKTKSKIHQFKLESLVLRKAIAPLREAIGKFARTESPFVDESTKIFLRDLYDHTVQLMDLLETHRDVLNGLYDLYLSEISFKMNNVMQVLTVISTIFIPLTFLVGVYGMNFDNMPELHWKNGYFYLWGFMVFMALALIWFFRRRRWL